MLKGAGNTISIVVFAIFMASLMGLAVGVARLSGNPLISGLGKLYVELFRNLSLLLIMFFFAFRGLQTIARYRGAFRMGRGLLRQQPRTGRPLARDHACALVAVAHRTARCRRGRLAR